MFSQDLVRAAESLFDGLFKKGPRAPAVPAAPPARTGGSWWLKEGGEAPWYPKAWQPKGGGAWGKGEKRHGQDEGAEGKSCRFGLSRWPFPRGVCSGQASLRRKPSVLFILRASRVCTVIVCVSQVLLAFRGSVTSVASLAT